MKSLLFVGCFLALLASPLSAQTAPAPATSPSTPPPADTGGKQHHPDFLKQIGLSADTMAQVEAIKKGGGDKKSKKEAIKALLTADQISQLKALKKEWKAEHPKTA